MHLIQVCLLFFVLPVGCCAFRTPVCIEKGQGAESYQESTRKHQKCHPPPMTHAETPECSFLPEKEKVQGGWGSRTCIGDCEYGDQQRGDNGRRADRQVWGQRAPSVFPPKVLGVGPGMDQVWTLGESQNFSVFLKCTGAPRNSGGGRALKQGG